MNFYVYAESVPLPSSPERPPLAPYDPPDPAPQARAWRRAIKVVLQQEAERGRRVAVIRDRWGLRPSVFVPQERLQPAG